MSSNSRTRRFFGAALMALALGALPSLYADEAVLQAFINSRDTSPTLTLGRTRSDLTQCIQWAEEYGIPLVAIWSNEGCAHCERLERAMTSEAFRAHALKSGLIICAIFNSDGKGSITKSDPEGVRNGSGYHWCWGYGNNSIYKKISMFPFVRFYWKKDGKQIVDAVRTGDNVDGNVGTDVSTGTMTDAYGTYATVAGKTANKAGLYTIDYMIKMFPGYEPVTLTDYAGGEFASGTDTENDRLEIEAGTTNVTVNLVRDAGTAASPATNILTVAYPAGKPAARLLGAATAAVTGDTSLIWEVGETNKTVNVPIKSANLSDGDAITLLLKDENGEARGTNHIWFVEKAVSAANPLWIGERTKDTLQAGEWTMDLDVALARTAAQAGDAYTLVEFTGALWCPWCRGGESYFLETDAFKSFVADKNISLVCLDNPRRFSTADSYGEGVSPKSVSAGPYGKAPTFLRADVGTSGNTTASGLGYMTRKMISKKDAEAVLQRNHDLGYIGGAYATPDAYRTGYPTFVLLDKSGTVIGRLNYQYGETKDNDSRYPFDLAENMIRLTNLVETASAEREANRYATTTELSAAVGTPVTVDLGINCPEQGIRLENIPSGTVEFSSADNVVLTLLRLDSVVLQRKDATNVVAKTETVTMPTTVATGTNSMSYAFSAEDASASYIFKVAAYEGADTKKFGAAGLAMRATVTSATVLTPAEKSAEFTPVTDSIALEIEEGTVYKLSGSWQDLTVAFSSNGDGTWTATKSGRVTLAVTAGEAVVYQIWRPGSVGFTTTSRTVKEKDQDVVDEVPVSLSRIGGVSGSVTVTVSLDKDNTNLTDFEGAPRYEFTPATITWADGENFMTNVTIKIVGDNNYDGDGTVALNISLDDGASALTNSTFVLTVTDNDERAPGSAAFVESGTIYFKESAGATVHAVRKTASDGAVSVAVTTTAGTLSSEEVSWANRNSDAQEVTLTGLVAGKAATLTLKAASGGVTVPSASRTVKVTAVADDAPEFAESAVSLALARYVATSNILAVKEGTFTPGNTLTFTKKTGALPPGLAAKWDKEANALAIVGTPSKAGTYTAVYQVSEKRGSKSVAGLTTEISFNIVDPATGDGGEGAVANEAVAKSRTFKDVMVLDGGELKGLLKSLAIPSSGCASAKFICSDGTISLAAKSWSDYDGATGALTATLVGSTKKTAGWSLALTAKADGAVDLVLTDPEGTAIPVAIAGTQWSEDNTASAYEGYYTVTLPIASVVVEETKGLAPTGSGYLTITMQGKNKLKSGEAKWGGKLPNGTTISGSAILTDADSSAFLPVFAVSSKDIVAGVARILKDAKSLKASGNYQTVSAPAECPAMTWRHVEAAGSGASFDVTLGVYGGLYDKNDELGALCKELYNSTDMHLVAEGIDGTSGVSVSEHGIKLNTNNGLSAKLTFDSEKGIVSGKLSNGAVEWCGVVLLGWIDCGCSAASSETTFPFVTGAFFYDNKVTYETPAGKTKTISVKSGGKAKIDCTTTFE